MKNILKNRTFIKICTIFLSAFVSACGIKLIVQPNGFLAGGVSGITVLVSRFTSIQLDKPELESLLYSVLYAVFNIPIFVFGFKKIGKQFIAYSILNVALFTLLVSLIPSSWGSKLELGVIDPLTCAIMAGLLSGVGAVLAFSHEFSPGGTDIISVYLSRTKGKGIGSYNLLMNTGVLILGWIAFGDFPALIYTVVYFFVNSLVVNNLYIGHKKTLVEIITSNHESMVDILMNESHHGCTMIDAVGAYSKNSKKVLRIVVSANQAKRICDIVKKVDSKSFTILTDIKQVNGRFYIPPMK